MSEQQEINVTNFRQYLDNYPGAQESEVEDDDEHDEEKGTRFVWSRANPKTGDTEYIALDIFTDSVRWFIKRNRKEKKGRFVYSAIECVDMVHKFFNAPED